MQASIGYGGNHGMRGIDSRDAIAGLAAPFGPHWLAGTFVRKRDRAGKGSGADQLAAAYSYAFSRRTDVYAAYSRLSNTRFTTSKFGDGSREIDLGVKHRF